MDLAALGLMSDNLAQEGDELHRGVSTNRLAHDFAGLGVQSCEQGQGAMAVVLKTVPFGSPRRQGQDGVVAVQRLDGRLFIHARDGGMLRGLQVRPMISVAFSSKAGSLEAK